MSEDPSEALVGAALDPGQKLLGVSSLPAHLCRFLFFRFLWLLWWLPEAEEAAFWGFTP